MSDHTQELFDKVATHLLSQGQKSYDRDNGCQYRHGNLRCAVGCLINDAHYDKELENKSVDRKTVIKAVEGSLGFTLNYRETSLLRSLQDIHDVSSPATWLSKLIVLAQLNKLSVEVLRQST